MFRYDRLDELVEQTGKKKNYLSKKIGHAGRYLNDARKQKTNIKREEVEILAQELGTSAEYLCGETDIKKPTAPKDDGLTDIQNEAMDFMRSLTPEQLRRFIAMGKAAFEEEGK